MGARAPGCKGGEKEVRTGNTNLLRKESHVHATSVFRKLLGVTYLFVAGLLVKQEDDPSCQA